MSLTTGSSLTPWVSRSKSQLLAQLNHTHRKIAILHVKSFFSPSAQVELKQLQELEKQLEQKLNAMA